jgi:tetratricopeptide (TPR) repeat protein
MFDLIFFVMNKKTLALIVLFYFTIYSLQAQIRISGSVIDQTTKEPILYATISFPERNIGTISDVNGKFSIYIADTTVCKSLVFSCVGYQRQDIPIVRLLKEKTVYMKPVVSNLSGVEVKAMSYNALLELTDKVFKKARSNTKMIPCKVFYSLESDKSDEPLELVEAFYSGTQSMRYGMEEMKLKNGRIGLNTETEDKIMNISSTNLIINFLPYTIPANTIGLPPMPSNYNVREMAENFSFYEDGMFKEDTASLKKVSFHLKDKKKIEGSILFYNNSLQMKQYDIWIHNAEGVLFPAIKGDKLDSVNIHLVYTYKKDEKNAGNMLLERINMDYSLNYYSAQTDNYLPINTSSFLLFYDYEHPFNPPFFKDTKMPSDYIKIWAFPYMDVFWQHNYFLPENEKKEERLLFFEKNGIVKNQEDSPFNPDVEGLKSPLRAWSKERVDIEKTTINSMFPELEGIVSTTGVMDLKKLKMTDALYNVDAQIYMDYMCVNDSLHFTTKTFINLETSYFLPTPNAYAAAYVNMYFDLHEMSRRNLEQRLKQLSVCSAKEVEKIYSEEMKLLNNNLRKFKNGTNDATDIYTLMNWWNIINDSLHIDQSQLLNKPISDPSYFMTSDEISLISVYFYNTGLVLLQLGQYEESYRYFKKAIEKGTDGKNHARLARFYFGLAEAYYYLGYMDLSCEALNQSITLDKDIGKYAQKYLKECPSE